MLKYHIGSNIGRPFLEFTVGKALIPIFYIRDQIPPAYLQNGSIETTYHIKVEKVKAVGIMVKF